MSWKLFGQIVLLLLIAVFALGMLKCGMKSCVKKQWKCGTSMSMGMCQSCRDKLCSSCKGRMQK